MKLTLELLDHADATRVHETSLDVLSRTGMTFESERLLAGLSEAGARAARGSSEMHSAAHERRSAFLAGRDFWEVEVEKEREIDRIVRNAESIL